MEKHFDIPRTIRRVKPKHAATAAVFGDSQLLTYGVVTNLSVTGACIVTESEMAPGSDVDLKLSFYRYPDLYEIGARVVWNRCGGAREKGFEGLQLHGVRFNAFERTPEIAPLHDSRWRGFRRHLPSLTGRWRFPVSSTSSLRPPPFQDLLRRMNLPER